MLEVSLTVMNAKYKVVSFQDNLEQMDTKSVHRGGLLIE